VTRPLADRPARILIVVVLAVTAAVAIVPHGAAQTVEPPPPTPVPVPGGGTSPSPFPSVLRTPPPSTEPPEVHAGAAILMDLESGRTLYASNANERRPIASLTKIMTAYLVMTRTSPDEIVTVSETAATGTTVGISSLGLGAGERIRVGELLYALMLQSANDAAVALAEHVAGSVDEFVSMMNRTAARLGLGRTSFSSPNGLDDSGYSTARDLARLTRVTYEVPGFEELVSTSAHAVMSRGVEPRVVQNRNALLWLYPGATGVKTGFTTPAGFCVVGTAVRGDEQVVVIVLGAPGEAFTDAATLMNFGFAGFDRRLLIAEGRSLGTVDVDGRAVSVAAGESRHALVFAGSTVQPEVVPDPTVRFPPGRGDQIGVVRLTSSGSEVATVPLVVVDVAPPPPPRDDGPWWLRGAGSIARAGGSLVRALFG
jgi:serine-type D-Ala-D-Ala carboxypeptidase (penicillin-binding protein 5/6)